MKTFDHPAGDDTDDSAVQLVIKEHNGPMVVRIVQIVDLAGEFFGASKRFAFERLATRVLFVEVMGEFACSPRIFGGQQFDAEPGVTKPTTGIEPRSKLEANVTDFDLFLFRQVGTRD